MGGTVILNGVKSKRSEDPENRGGVKNPLVVWKGLFFRLFGTQTSAPHVTPFNSPPHEGGQREVTTMLHLIRYSCGVSGVFVNC
jgi:hypothetical protein